jgi:hypothetical protein
VKKGSNSKLIYVAGPYRAPTQELIDANIRKVGSNAAKIWKMGHYALAPHYITRFHDCTPSDRALLDSVPMNVYLEGTMEMMRRCDAVFLGEGWEKSSGSTAEKAEAQRLGIPVFTNFNELQNWLNSSIEHKKEEAFRI